jgi:hypothetical protein
MLHFNNQQGWWDEKGIWVREMVVPKMEPHGTDRGVDQCKGKLSPIKR